jgi:hypothetical protein
MTYLNGAAFPVYVVHQTILVAIGYGVVGWGVPSGIQFAVIIPGETVVEMAARWEQEVVRRVRTRESNAIVFQAGRADARQKSSLSMVRLSLASSLDSAKNMGFKAMLVGPPPGTPEDNEAIAELSAIAEDVASRRGVPYVDTYGPLVTHEQWVTDMATSVDALPGSAGYGLLAWLVLHAKWREWLGLPTDV